MPRDTSGSDFLSELCGEICDLDLVSLAGAIGIARTSSSPFEVFTVTSLFRHS